MRQDIDFLKKLPANVFAGIYAACNDVWAGATYNGVYYDEWSIYIASLERDEGYEVLL